MGSEMCIRDRSNDCLAYFIEKKMRLRRNGEVYEISPWALNWGDENDYMIGYDKRAGKIKHYRVDNYRKRINVLD